MRSKKQSDSNKGTAPPFKPPEHAKPPQKTPSSEERERYEGLKQSLDDIDTWVNTAAENGLFKKQSEIDYDDIQNHIYCARRYLESQNYTDAEYFLSKSIDLYGKALYARDVTKGWRWENVYAVPVWAYLVAFIIGVFLFYYFGIFYHVSTIFLKQIVGTENVETATHAVVWGMLGGIFRGIWYLKERVGDRIYRNAWVLFFVSGPFIGGFFGALVYFVMVGGLLSLQSNPDISITNPLVIIPFAFLAGFNWYWTLNLINKISETIFATAPPPKI